MPSSSEPLLKLRHQAPSLRKKKKLLSAFDLAKVGFFLFGMPKNAFGSIDVSKECNLRCQHCYFFEDDHARELTVEQWVEQLEALRETRSALEFPFFQCTWVGGEPLIRKELIERGRKYFRHNTVVTNGTIPLPDWPDVNWYISLDGDEETHERIRNKKGIYRRALRNISEHPDLTVTLAYCITAQNVHCLEQAILDGVEAGASHMTFDFYTPIETIEQREAEAQATRAAQGEALVGDTAAPEIEPLFLSLDERDKVIDQLLALKKIYGDYFIIPERTLRMMKSDVSRQVTDNCLFSTHSFAFGPDGQQKEKCMMGAKADCDRCGCVVPFYLASLTDRRMITEDVRREMSAAAQRAARGVVTAVLG